MTGNYKQYPSKNQLPDDQRKVIAFGGDYDRLMVVEYYERKDVWLIPDQDGFLATHDEIKWWA